MAETVLVDPSTAVPEPRFHPPGDKTALSATSFGTGLGLMASATISAGIAGVQRVITGASFSMCTTPSVLATSTIAVQILNGSALLWGAVLSVASNGISPPFSTPPLNLLTSAATEVTARFSNSVANATQFVTLTYHDIGV